MDPHNPSFFQVHINQVEPGPPSSLGGYRAVDENFGGGQVSSWGSDVVFDRDISASDGNADPLGIRFLWAEVRYHADMGGGLVGGYVVSMDGEKCVCFFYVFPTLYQSSKLSVSRFLPGGSILAVNASGKEVADTCFCASGWVCDCVGEMVGNEVCVVWASLDSGGDDKVACLVGWGCDSGDAQGWG